MKVLVLPGPGLSCCVTSFDSEKCAQRMQTARNVRKFVISLISSLKFSAAWFGEMLRRMRNRKEREVGSNFGGVFTSRLFSSLQHFNVGLKIRRSATTARFLRPVQIFNPAFQFSW